MKRKTSEELERDLIRLEQEYIDLVYRIQEIEEEINSIQYEIDMRADLQDRYNDLKNQ